MTDLSPGLIVLLIAVLIGGVLVIRFARQIAHFLLVAGALAVAGLIAWALIAQATASRRIADTTHIAVAAAARRTARWVAFRQWPRLALDGTRVPEVGDVP